MVVAFGTLNCQTQQVIHHHFVSSLQNLMMNVSTIQFIGIRIVGTVSQESGRNEQRLHLRRVLIGVPPVDTFIPGELFHHKPIERLVAVQRRDDIVAIKPFVFSIADCASIVIQPHDVDISRIVQPVPTPSFTEMR